MRLTGLGEIRSDDKFEDSGRMCSVSNCTEAMSARTRGVAMVALGLSVVSGLHWAFSNMVTEAKESRKRT
jgi:hypothetical protein